MYCLGCEQNTVRSGDRIAGVSAAGGNPLRWRLLTELARSDRHVQELTSLLDRPQNLVSYHLGKLRAAGLVSARRSSADARGTYYTVDLGRFGELLAQTGRTVHPGLRLAPAPPLVPAAPAGRTAARLLFLCTGNSARSQIAEALAVARSGGRVEAHSAGSRPKPLHPNTVRVLRERGIEVGSRQPKHLSIFAADRFDYVITLCDKVREVCPEFPVILAASTGASRTRPRPGATTTPRSRRSGTPRPRWNGA